MEIKYSEVDKSKCRHTPGADELDYTKYSVWRAEMQTKGYRQQQCPNCGSWAIWEKKK